jgi:hypothetical protein
MNSLKSSEITWHTRTRFIEVLIVVSFSTTYIKFICYSSRFKDVRKMRAPTLQMCNWDDLVQNYSPHFEMLSCKVKQNGLSIGSYYLLKNFNVSIKISILHICRILKFLIRQFISWFKANCNRWVPWWHEYPWIKWSSSWQSSIRQTSKQFSIRLWMWINPSWLLRWNTITIDR